MIKIIMIIVIVIVINSYIIIKDNDNHNDDENNAPNNENKKYLKKYSLCEWSFLIITITITTNKTTGEKTDNDTNLLHPNYEESTLSNMQRKRIIH